MGTGAEAGRSRQEDAQESSGQCRTKRVQSITRKQWARRAVSRRSAANPCQCDPPCGCLHCPVHALSLERVAVSVMLLALGPAWSWGVCGQQAGLSRLFPRAPPQEQQAQGMTFTRACVCTACKPHVDEQPRHCNNTPPYALTSPPFPPPDGATGKEAQDAAPVGRPTSSQAPQAHGTTTGPFREPRRRPGRDEGDVLLFICRQHAPSGLPAQTRALPRVFSSPPCRVRRRRQPPLAHQRPHPPHVLRTLHPRPRSRLLH